MQPHRTSSLPSPYRWSPQRWQRTRASFQGSTRIRNLRAWTGNGARSRAPPFQQCNNASPTPLRERRDVRNHCTASVKPLMLLAKDPYKTITHRVNLERKLKPIAIVKPIESSTIESSISRKRQFLRRTQQQPTRQILRQLSSAQLSPTCCGGTPSTS